MCFQIPLLLKQCITAKFEKLRLCEEKHPLVFFLAAKIMSQFESDQDRFE